MRGTVAGRHTCPRLRNLGLRGAVTQAPQLAALVPGRGACKAGRHTQQQHSLFENERHARPSLLLSLSSRVRREHGRQGHLAPANRSKALVVVQSSFSVLYSSFSVGHSSLTCPGRRAERLGCSRGGQRTALRTPDSGRVRLVRGEGRGVSD